MCIRDSNKTVRNLFDMLDVPQNAPAQMEAFRQALENSGNGWAVFTYQGEKTVFCFIPLQLQSDWYLVSIIPKDTVNEQTHEILMRALTLMASIILGISILAAFYIRYVRRTLSLIHICRKSCFGRRKGRGKNGRKN